MALNITVREHNSEYLKQIIGDGQLINGNVYKFYGLDKLGRDKGYEYLVFMDEGIISREDTLTGESIEKGYNEESRDKRGYITIEMVTPYDPCVHMNTSEKNYYMDGPINVVGVQHTCYIHVIINIINCIINNEDIDGVANHKDGCKFHNWASNIENCSSKLNRYHGAVFNSILHHKDVLENCFGLPLVSVDSNMKYAFPVLLKGISAKDIWKVMLYDSELRDEVIKCASALMGRENGTDVKYISVDRLMFLLIETGNVEILYD